MKEAFRVAMVDINREGEYEDCCTLYTNREIAQEKCYELAIKFKKLMNYEIKPFKKHPWQFAKICHQNTTIKILYECEHDGKRKYIGYTTYILK